MSRAAKITKPIQNAAEIQVAAGEQEKERIGKSQKK